MDTNVGTFSITFCRNCSPEHYISLGLAYTATEAYTSALAKSTQSSLASRIRHMERVLYDILGVTYLDTMPTAGTVSKALLHTFLLARKTEGASR